MLANQDQNLKVSTLGELYFKNTIDRLISVTQPDVVILALPQALILITTKIVLQKQIDIISLFNSNNYQYPINPIYSDHEQQLSNQLSKLQDPTILIITTFANRIFELIQNPEITNNNPDNMGYNSQLILYKQLQKAYNKKNLLLLNLLKTSTENQNDPNDLEYCLPRLENTLRQEETSYERSINALILQYYSKFDVTHRGTKFTPSPYISLFNSPYTVSMISEVRSSTNTADQNGNNKQNESENTNKKDGKPAVLFNLKEYEGIFCNTFLSRLQFTYNEFGYNGLLFFMAAAILTFDGINLIDNVESLIEVFNNNGIAIPANIYTYILHNNGVSYECNPTLQKENISLKVKNWIHQEVGLELAVNEYIAFYQACYVSLVCELFPQKSIFSKIIKKLNLPESSTLHVFNDPNGYMLYEKTHSHTDTITTLKERIKYNALPTAKEAFIFLTNMPSTITEHQIQIGIAQHQ